jgi:hypothetical protein
MTVKKRMSESFWMISMSETGKIQYTVVLINLKSRFTVLSIFMFMKYEEN